MFNVIVWLMVIVSILMILIVLVQRSKGGGLNSNMAGAQQIMGVRKSTDFVEKATWVLAGALLVFSLVSVAVMPTRDVANSSKAQEALKDFTAPQATQQSFEVQQTPAEAPAAEAQEAPAE